MDVAPGVSKLKASSIHPLDYEPPARFHHCGAVASDRKFYSYGGRFGHVKPGSSSYKEKDELRRRETSSSVVRTTINRFDAATERWHCLPTSGNPPPGRIGVACAVVGSKFYVFGGRSRNRLFSTLSELDLDTMIWKELEPLSPPDNTPMAKMGAAMVSIDNRYLIVYGGYGVPAAAHGQVQGVEYVPDPGKGVWTNELHCFDLKTGKWCRQLTVGESPAPCSGCTFTLVGKRRAVLFGGSQLSNNCVPNNVHILDLKSWKWEQVCHDNDTPWPEARVGHSAVSLHDPDSSPEEPELLILWGQDDETPVSTLKDGWVLKICKNGTLEWTEILLPGDIQGRLCHTTALFHLSPTQKRIVNFGGVEENDKPPIAKSLVMDISTGETPTGRWTVSKARKPDPKTLVHLKSDPEYPGVKFFAESLRETIPSKNQSTVLDRRDIGMKLSIPEGAVQDETKDAVQLDVQPCFNGPFKVPPGCQLTSPVYMIRKQCKFKKHVKMEIEHFANLESGEDSEEMVFVAANPSPSYHGAHPVYNLQEIEKSGHSSTFTPGEQVGVITFQELKPGPLGTARKSTNGIESGWKYSVRLYKSPPSLLFNLAVFTICRLHSVYLKHLESLIKENYPSVRMQTSNQPMDFTSSAAEITTDSIEGWTIVPSRKPTVITKDEVDLPEHVEISPGELDYPPRIDFSFYSDSRHNDTIEVCNLNVNGLDRNVCIPITLALPAPPHSPTSAVGRHVSFDSTPPPSPRHHRDRLTTKDLHTLLTMLHGATTKWELIGLALGFDPEDLKIIEQTPTLIPKGPVAYLREMLHQWLKWCPPNHEWPTVSSLCEALRSPTVGDECLADTLKDQLRPFRGRNGPSEPDDRNITEAASELERQAEQCASDNVMGTTTKKIVKLMKQVEPLLIDPTLTQQLVDQTKLIDAECQQLVELAKEVQKHAVERTKHDLSTQITRVVSFAHQLSHLASARLKSRTANDIDVDIVEAAKNLTSSIGGILSSTGAATLQVTFRQKPRLSIQASRSNLREEKRRQTSVDVEALKQALEAKDEKPRRLRAQTSVDVKALAQVLEAQGFSFTKGTKD